MTHSNHARLFRLSSLLTLATPLLSAVVASADPGTIKTFCRVEPVVSSQQVQGRATTILFPDGREIMLVGHQPSKPQIVELSELVQSQQIFKMTDQQFDGYLRLTQMELTIPQPAMALKAHRQSIVDQFRKYLGYDVTEEIDPSLGIDQIGANPKIHALQDYQFVRDVLAQPAIYGRFMFIGLENGSKIWPNQKTQMMIAQQNLEREIKRRRKSGVVKISDNDLNELMVASSGGNLFAYLHDPRLEKVAQLVPIDDAVDSTEMAALTKKLKELWRGVRAHNGKDPHQRGTVMLMKLLETAALDGDIGSMNELEKRLAAMKTAAAPLIGENYEQITNVYREAVRAHLVGDTETARKLVERNQSGIHFVSMSHYQPMVQGLKKLCDAELAASREGFQPVLR